jgi:hypothetical protein
MLPVPGAGDYLNEGLFPEGAGNGAPSPVGSGAGDYLLELPFSLKLLNNVIIRETSCRILTLAPLNPSSDRSFFVEREGGLCRVTPLTPGSDYLVTVMVIDPETGDESYIDTLLLHVPSFVEDADGVVVASKIPRQHYLLEALTYAVGKVVQSLGGKPSCRITEECVIGGRVLFVNSTLGFARSGDFLLNGRPISYIDKCDTAFILEQPTMFDLPEGELCVSVVKSIPPRRTFR